MGSISSKLKANQWDTTKKMFCQWDSLVMQVMHRCLTVCSRFKTFYVTCVKLATVICIFVRHQKMCVTQQGYKL